MKASSKLLEHVCERIGQRLFSEFPTIQEIIIRLSKEIRLWEVIAEMLE